MTRVQENENCMLQDGVSVATENGEAKLFSLGKLGLKLQGLCSYSLPGCLGLGSALKTYFCFQELSLGP